MGGLLESDLEFNKSFSRTSSSLSSFFFFFLRCGGGGGGGGGVEKRWETKMALKKRHGGDRVEKVEKVGEEERDGESERGQLI